nr:methyltransferase domain-containing protein [Brevibacterium sp. RIT 803]
MIGTGYRQFRRPEPEFARAIHAALGDARNIVNVGAGAGSYEPNDREVIAVEPSSTMRAQRTIDQAPVVDAVAESLPFADGAFDAALSTFSIPSAASTASPRPISGGRSCFLTLERGRRTPRGVSCQRIRPCVR